MFGLGKKKQKFNRVAFVGVADGSLMLKITNDKGDSEHRYLPLKDIERHLPSRVVEKVVTKTQSSIWHVLAIMPTTDQTKVLSAYKKMALVYHPDHGGTSEAFQTLTQAKDKALAKCR